MSKQEKVFVVNLLLICLAFAAGLFVQTEYKVLPQEAKVIEVQKVIVQKDVQVIEVPRDCPQPTTKKGFFN